MDQPFTDCHFDLLRFVQRLPLPYIQHALPGELPPHVVSVDAKGDRRRHRGVCTRGVYCRRRDVGVWGRYGALRTIWGCWGRSRGAGDELGALESI